jgi:uncharacterized protein (TIGR02246 family)
MDIAAGRSDEQQIRELVSTWMSATKRGDLDALLALIAEDVVFLAPGQAPMSKAGYASLQKAQWAKGLPDFEGTSAIQEIEVLGDWAFMWTKLAIVVTPPGSGPRISRAGHTLSILKREHGKWLLARDANMLAPSPSTGQ